MSLLYECVNTVIAGKGKGLANTDFAQTTGGANFEL